MGPRSIFDVKGYNIERADGDKPGKWGVVTLIKAGINYTRAAVPGGVQAVHLVVDRHHASPLNVVNVYAPPSMALPAEYLKTVVNLSSLVLLGDFNARHPL